jgi:hypothetical protein
MKVEDFYKLNKGDLIKTSQNGRPRKILNVMRISGKTYVIRLKYINTNAYGKKITYRCSCDCKNMIKVRKIKKNKFINFLRKKICGK